MTGPADQVDPSTVILNEFTDFAMNIGGGGNISARSSVVIDFGLRFEEALFDENREQRPLREALCTALELSPDTLDSNILAEVVSLIMTAERCDREHDND